MLQGDGGVTPLHGFTLPARCAPPPSLKGGPKSRSATACWSEVRRPTRAEVGSRESGVGPEQRLLARVRRTLGFGFRSGK